AFRAFGIEAKELIDETAGFREPSAAKRRDGVVGDFSIRRPLGLDRRRERGGWRLDHRRTRRSWRNGGGPVGGLAAARGAWLALRRNFPRLRRRRRNGWRRVDRRRQRHLLRVGLIGAAARQRARGETPRPDARVRFGQRPGCAVGRA